MASRDEILRIVLKTEGSEEIAGLAKEIHSLGDVSAEADAKASALLDEFANAKQKIGLIDQFRTLRQETIATNREFLDSQERLRTLAQAIKAVEVPAAGLVREYERAQSVTKRLSDQQDQQKTTLTALTGKLQQVGLDVRALGQAEQQAAQSAELATNKLRALVEAQRTAAQEANRLAQAERTVTKEQVDLAASSETTSGVLSRMFGGLKGLALGAGTFLGLSKLKEGLTSVLETGDKFEIFEQRLTTAFKSVEKGQEAFAFIKQFAKDTPLELDQVTEAFLQLKNFGLDPTNGTLKALVDQNAALGGSYEKLNGIVIALGQAWAKQKLQGQEILQLVNQGVPVYDLLSKATGKSAAAIQQLAEQGKLGRDVIQQLIAEIGKQNIGAAAKQMETLTGLVSNLKDRAAEFLNKIATSGALDFFRGQLKSLGDEIDRMSRSGGLADLAQRISNGIIGASQAVKSFVVTLYDYSGALLQLAKGYAALKVAGLLVDLTNVDLKFLSASKSALQLAESTTTSTSAINGLRGAFRSLPASVQIAIALLGIDLAIKGAKQLGDALYDLSPASKAAAQAQSELRETAIGLSNRYADLSKQFAEFRKQQVLSAEQTAALSESERAAYSTGLEGLRQFTEAQIRSIETLQKAGIATDEQVKQLENLRTSLTTVKGGFDALSSGAATASDAITQHLTTGALEFKKALAGIDTDAKAAAAGISGIFQQLDFGDIKRVGDLSLAINAIAKSSDKAAIAVRDGLGEALKTLSGDQLQQFQSASLAAFEALGINAKDAAAVLDTVLLTALERLGVSAGNLGVDMTKAGRDIIATFTTVAENIRASGAQIEAAFKAAIAKTSTLDEAKQLGRILETAAAQGRIGFEQAERAAAALERQIHKINEGLNPLADAFAVLGVKSQQQLEDTRISAQRAFNEIVDGARRGIASQEDVRRAFVAYAQTALAASKDSAGFAKEQVESQLKVQASVLGVTDALKDAGLAGETSGKQVTEAYTQAQAAIDAAATAAGNLATNSGTAAAATNQAAKAATAGAQAAQGAFVALNNEQTRAQNVLNEYLFKFGNLANIGLSDAQFILSQLGGIIGQTADELRGRIAELTQTAQQAEQAAQQLRSMRQQLQDDSDRASGNDTAIENRQFAEKLRQIEELAKASGAAGIADAQELRRLAEEEHQRKLKQIEERKNAEINANREVTANRNQSASASNTNAAGNLSGTISPIRQDGPTSPPVNINNILIAADNKTGLALARLINPHLEAIVRRSR